MTLEVGDVYTYPGCEIQILSITNDKVKYLKTHHGSAEVESIEPRKDLEEFLTLWQFTKAAKGYCLHQYEFIISFTTLGNKCVRCGKMEKK